MASMPSSLHRSQQCVPQRSLPLPPKSIKLRSTSLLRLARMEILLAAACPPLHKTMVRLVSTDSLLDAPTLDSFGRSFSLLISCILSRRCSCFTQDCNDDCRCKFPRKHKSEHTEPGCMSSSHGVLSTLRLSLISFILDFNQGMMDMLKIKSTDPAIESISGSPARSGGRNSSTFSGPYAARATLGPYTSPSNAQKIGGRVHPFNTSATSSPNSGRLRHIHETANWRAAEEDEESPKCEADYQAPNFVGRAGNETDDVFGPPGIAKQSIGQSRSAAL